jgi:hypothetical protein
MDKLRRGPVLLVLLAGVTAAAPASFADDYLVPTSNYSPTCNEGSAGSGPVCQTDNRNVYWYMDSNGQYELESPDRQDVHDAINDNYRPTDLDFTYDSSPVFSGDAETDVIYQEGAVDNGFVGYAWCDDAVGFFGHDCDQTYIRIEGAGEYTPGIACHETGHAVGLVHGENSAPRRDNQDSTLMGCMVKSNVPVFATLRSGQKSDINDVY